MMRPSRGLAVAASVSVAGVCAHMLAKWWYRRAEQHAAATSAADRGHEVADEVCAICLAKPQFRCKTDCGHIFCTDCFAAWWRRQPGNIADGDLAAARCPLCTQRVSYVTAHFTPGEMIEGGVARASKILLYNCCVSLSTASPTRLGWMVLERSRVATLLTALVLYAVRWSSSPLRLDPAAAPKPCSGLQDANACRPTEVNRIQRRHFLACRPTQYLGLSRSCRHPMTRRCGSMPGATCSRLAGQCPARSSVRRT